jgi:hypothetical protein
MVGGVRKALPMHEGCLDWKGGDSDSSMKANFIWTYDMVPPPPADLNVSPWAHDVAATVSACAELRMTLFAQLGHYATSLRSSELAMSALAEQTLDACQVSMPVCPPGCPHTVSPYRSPPPRCIGRLEHSCFCSWHLCHGHRPTVFARFSHAYCGLDCSSAIRTARRP